MEIYYEYLIGKKSKAGEKTPIKTQRIELTFERWVTDTGEKMVRLAEHKNIPTLKQLSKEYVEGGAALYRTPIGGVCLVAHGMCWDDDGEFDEEASDIIYLERPFSRDFQEVLDLLELAHNRYKDCLKKIEKDKEAWNGRVRVIL